MNPDRSKPKAQHLMAAAAALLLQALPPHILRSTVLITGATLMMPDSNARAESVTEYLEKAQKLHGKEGRELEVIDLANKALAIVESSRAYSFRAYAKSALKDHEGAIADYSKALAINPKDIYAYENRAHARNRYGDSRGECEDYKILSSLGDKQTAKWLNSENGAWCRTW